MRLPALLALFSSALLVSAQQPQTTDTVSDDAVTSSLINIADPQNTSDVAIATTTGELSSTTSSVTVTSTGADGSVTTSISTTATAVTTAQSTMNGAGAKVTGLPGVMAAAGGMVVLGMW